MRKLPSFISFEGIDGAGKSSHVGWLREHLESRGCKVICTREPGGTPLGEKLRALLLNDDMCGETELMLMFAARKQHLVEVIEPAIRNGYIVLSDRFHDSSYAFQAGGRDMPYSKIASLDAWVGGLRPDLTLYFDLDIDTASRRMEGTRTLDRFEAEKRDFHNNVRSMYLRLARENPKRIVTLDASRTIEELHDDIAKIFSN